MSGFEGNDTSRPKWTTDFEDNQLSKVNNGEPWIDYGYAGWGTYIEVSFKDSGNKVSCKCSSQVIVYIIFRESPVIINKDILQK